MGYFNQTNQDYIQRTLTVHYSKIQGFVLLELQNWCFQKEKQHLINQTKNETLFKAGLTSPFLFSFTNVPESPKKVCVE